MSAEIDFQRLERMETRAARWLRNDIRDLPRTSGYEEHMAEDVLELVALIRRIVSFPSQPPVTQGEQT